MALAHCGATLPDEQKRLICSSGRTNTSSRKNKADYYYDDETAVLVQGRDSLIIEKHGYKLPAVS